MFLDKIDGILPGQFVRVKYECAGGFERCGKDWSLKLKDALKNHEKNEGKLICHQCSLKNKNPMRDKKIQQKIKNTNLQRYGVTCPLNTKKLIEKRSKKYENPSYVAEITVKRRETCLDTYGVDHPMKTEEVQEKQKAVIREKYGVDHPLQNTEILEKTKQTNLEKYGAEWGLATPEVRLKGIHTMLEKFGVSHYNKLPEMKEYLRANCKEWLAESYANPWAKGITRPNEWNEKQSATVCNQIDTGVWKGGGNHSLQGVYKAIKCKRQNPQFRSSYELIMHWYLDNSLEVEWYDYEPFQVPYFDTEGKKRHYTVDFVVKYENNRILKAFEIKNNYTKDNALNHNKYKAFRNQCCDLIELLIWANDDIKQLNIELEDLLKSDKVIILRNSPK